MLTTNQKLDITFKKMLGASETDSTATKDYFLEPPTTTVVDAVSIPIDRAALPPTAPTGSVGSKFNKDGTLTTTGGSIQKISETATPVAGKPEAFILATGMIIPFNFKAGAYAPKFYDQTGKEIPFGTNDIFFDADGGVIVFMGGVPSGVTSVRVDGWRYIGRTLADIAEASTPHLKTTYAIATDSLPAGMTWDVTDKKIAVNHNLNTLQYTTQLLIGATEFHTKMDIGLNTLTIYFTETPLLSHNITLNIIKHV